MQELAFTLRVRSEHLPTLGSHAVEIEVASLGLRVGADTVVEAAKQCAVELSARDYPTTAADVLVALEGALQDVQEPWPNLLAN